MVGGHGKVKSRHVDPYSSFFRRRRRFLPIFFFFFYFYYYKIMIMTQYDNENDYDCFQLKTKCTSKEKVCIQLCALLIVSLETSVRSSGPGSSKDGFNQDKKFKPGLSQRFSCLWTCNSCLQNTVEPLLGDTVIIIQNVTLSHTLGRWKQKRNKILIPDYR